MRAEIISIGTELLLGEIVDTNSQYVAARLPALGIDLYYKHTVGDNLGRLVEVIGRARGRAGPAVTPRAPGPPPTPAAPRRAGGWNATARSSSPCPGRRRR